MSIITKILLVFVGITFLVLSYFNNKEADAFVADSAVTFGKVVGFDIERSSFSSSTGSRDLYFPLIAYNVKDKSMIIKHLRGAYPPEHALGDVFEIIYKKSDPTNAKVNLPINIVGPVYFPAFVGVLLIVLGFGRFPRSISSKINRLANAVKSIKT